MKKILFIAVAAIACLTSCDKNTNNPDGERAVVSIQLDRSNFTRTLDNIDTDDVSQTAVTVQDALLIFIAQGDVIMVADDLAVGSTTGTYTKDKNGNDLTTHINKVIVVGNLPGNVTAATALAQTSVASLRTLLAQGLDQAQTDYLTDNSGSGKIWVQGEASIGTWTLNGSTGIQETSVSVALAPVLSRVDATVDMTQATNIYTSVTDLQATLAGSGQGMVVEGVALLYSANKSSLVAPFTPSDNSWADPVTYNVLLSGLTPLSTSVWNVSDHGKADLFAGDESFLKATWLGTSAWGSPANPNASGSNNSGATATNAGTFTRSFYAFSPKNYEASTGTGHFISDVNGYKATPILTVYGKRYDAAGNLITPVYFSFRFDSEDMTAAAGIGTNDPEMTPGIRYGIKLTFDGDFASEGSTTPEEEKNYGASITVTIQAAKWSAYVELEKTFD